MGMLDLLPFRQSAAVERSITPDDQSTLARLFKAVTLAVGFRGMGVPTRATFLTAPYDFQRIIQAIDTDSYVRQGFSKYKELMWKEGWEIVGENPEAVTYLYQRLDFMELSMRKPFHDFISEAADQLVKFSNAFLVKSRGDLGPYFPRSLDAPEGMLPIIGYELIPTETVEIQRDMHNVVIKYRQNIFTHATLGVSYPGISPVDALPTWDPDEIIHFYLDRKPGRSFGTPFLTTTMDDVIALRQMEEDIQNLVHRELFPLYKYKVGTEDHPADPGEVDQAARELESMRTEGGLVLPERHDVEVIGSQGAALQVEEYLEHFKERVCVGLGLAPHHLGMSGEGSNRAVTDRLDIALYDKVKTIQRYVARMIEFHIFADLLLEGGFDPFVTPSAAGVSDRCFFKFREIDVDTQVKRETHEINKFAQNVTTLPETRLALGLPPEAHEEDLMMGMQTRLQPTPVAPNADGKMPQPLKPDAKVPSAGVRPNKPNLTKGAGNIIRPANQHGRRTSPNIRHADLNGKLTELVLLIDDGSENGDA